MALIPNATTMPRGVIGTWANMEEDNARTGVASVEFASAIPLQRATGDQEVAPLTSGNVFVGIALRTVDMNGAPTSDGAATYSIGQLLGVADMGTVFVLAGEDVTEGAVPFYDPATRQYHGATGTGRLPLTGCEFDEAAAEGSAVGLRIRLVPGSAVITAAS